MNFWQRRIKVKNELSAIDKILTRLKAQHSFEMISLLNLKTFEKKYFLIHQLLLTIEKG